MGYVCQKPGRFSGRDYVPGEPVPAEVVESDSGFLIGRGYVATIPDEDNKAELEAIKAKLASAIERAERAEARAAAAGEEADPEGGASPARTARKRASSEKRDSEGPGGDQ